MGFDPSQPRARSGKWSKVPGLADVPGLPHDSDTTATFDTASPLYVGKKGEVAAPSGHHMPVPEGTPKDEAIRLAIDETVAESVDLMLHELGNMSQRDWENMRPETRTKLAEVGRALGVEMGASEQSMFVPKSPTHALESSTNPSLVRAAARRLRK